VPLLETDFKSENKMTITFQSTRELNQYLDNLYKTKDDNKEKLKSESKRDNAKDNDSI
jgi:hypothetical protein